MSDPESREPEQLDRWLETEFEQALPGPTEPPTSPQPSAVLEETRRRLLEAEQSPVAAPSAPSPVLRLLVPASLLSVAAALVLMTWWNSRGGSAGGGVGAIEVVALEDLRAVVRREVLPNFEAFFSPELRGAGDPARPTILPVPSRTYPTLRRALAGARDGDVILLAQRERPSDLPPEVQWSEDAETRSVRINIDDRTLEVRFFSEASPAWRRVQDAYREESRDPSPSSPPGGGRCSLLLDLPASSWFVRVYGIGDRVAEIVFPFAPADAWFPATERRQLIPPAEPVISLQIPGGSELLLYPSQLAEPETPSVLPRLWISNAQKLFRLDADRLITRADAEVLPSPQGILVLPSYDYLLVVAASRPLSFPVPVNDLAIRLRGTASPAPIVIEWRDEWLRTADFEAVKVFLWTPTPE